MERQPERKRFRVWLVRYRNWKPRSWRDVPPTAEALEPLEPASFSAEEAFELVRGFNQTMLAEPVDIWSVPVRVQVRYQHDLEQGQAVTRKMIDQSVLRARAG